MAEPVAYLVERAADVKGYGSQRYVTLQDAMAPAFWVDGKIADGYTVTPLYAEHTSASNALLSHDCRSHMACKICGCLSIGASTDSTAKP